MAISSVIENKAMAFEMSSHLKTHERELFHISIDASVDDKLKFINQLGSRHAEPGVKDSIETVLETLLFDRSVEVRMATVRAISLLIKQNSDNVFLLGVALRDKDVGVQAVALDALRHNVEFADHVLPSLAGILRAGDAVFRTLVLKMVSQMGQKAYWLYPAVCHCLVSTERSIYVAACEALKSMTSDEAFLAVMQRVQWGRDQSGQLNGLLKKLN